jgi:hypothetical protein
MQTELGDVRRVADIIGVSASHLTKLRLYHPDQSPPFLRVGDRVLYPLVGENSLESWVAERTLSSKSGGVL